MADKQTSATLVALNLPAPRRYPLGDSTVLGRDDHCLVHLSDPLVSRRHAEIRREDDGRYILVHLGHTHATYVDGEPVKSVTRLKDGHEIILGSARFRFEQAELHEVGVANLDLKDSGSSSQVQHRIEVRSSEGFPPHMEISDDLTIRRDYEKLRVAHELGRSVAQAPNTEALLELVLLSAFELFAAERGAILLNEPEGHLHPVLAYSREQSPRPIVISATVVREVVDTRDGILSTDALGDDRFSGATSIVREGIRSTMCVPLLLRTDLIGVLYLDSRSSTCLFESTDLELLASLATQAASAIQNITLSDQLKEERNRLHRLVSALPDGVLVLDADDRILADNPRSQEILSRWTDAGIGDVLEKIAHYDLGEVLAQAAGAPMELEMVDDERRVLWVSVDNTADSGENLLLLRDVTYERERERVLAEHERARILGEFAHGVAHDFGNIMQIVDSHAELLQTSDATQDVKRRARSITKATQRALALTQRLVELARGGSPNPQVVGLNEVAGRVIAFLDSQLPADIEVKTDFQADPDQVEVDPSQIEQVLVNLALNARDAMPGGGTLTLSSRVRVSPDGSPDTERTIVLEVTDTGTGMDEKTLARAFEPFFTTKPQGQGTGLGLAMVRRMVEDAGARIEVSSELGEGTTFTIYFVPADG